MANGIIIAQGGRFGGWALSVKDGAPAYDYNFLGLQRFTVGAQEKLKPGKVTIRFDFAYDGGGLGKGGTGALHVNDKKVGEGRIEHTQPMVFSGDETADVGIDLATPVIEAIGSEKTSRFTGKIPKVSVEVKEMKKADKAEEDRALALAAHKKKLSECVGRKGRDAFSFLMHSRRSGGAGQPAGALRHVATDQREAWERTMKRTVFLITMLASVLVTPLAAPPAQAQAKGDEARSLLKAMSEYVSSQKTIALTFDSDIEVITPQLEKIQFTNSGEVLLSRPDKLRAHRVGGYADVALYFDGKTASVYGKRINRKMVITSKTLNSAPQYMLRVKGWKTGVQPAPDAFAFVPPTDAKKLSPDALIDLDELPKGAPGGGKP